MNLIQRSLVALVIAAVAAIVLGVSVRPESAAAHPLGNFTINRLVKVVVGQGQVHLRYVVDMAEIPAFQEVRRIDRDNDGAISDAEGRAYIENLAPQLARNLDLRIDSARIALAGGEGSAGLQPGQGGLSTLRIVIDYAVPLPDGWQAGADVSVKDGNYSDRLGWRDIVVQAGPGVVIGISNVSATDETAELTAYPEAQLKSPPDVRQASFRLAAGAVAGAAPAPATLSAPAKPRSPGKTLDGFASLVSRSELTPAFLVLSLLAAMAWGAAHALGPGHGKTIVAAYLVGEKGTAKHAAILGLTVTLTHTSTVFALGLVTLSFSQLIDTEDLYFWLSVGSGLMVVAMGLGLLVTRLRRATGQSGSPAIEHGSLHGDGHSHSHDGHAHSRPAPGDHRHDGAHMHGHDQAPGHGHSHGGHGHSHMPTAPGLKGLIALGVSGGLLPCPTALVVMLGSIALDRTVYGLALVLAFSVGLAGVLTGIGLLLVYARRFLERGSGRLGRLSPSLTRRALAAVPVLSSIAIVIAGMLLTSSALASA